MNTKKYIIIFILCIIFSSLVAVLLLQKPCWDFYGYHYYNGWAFLNGRIDTDFLACNHRTYYNPIFDAINYIIITRLNNHPLLYNIILHLKYGIFLFVSYLFYDFILKEQKLIKNISIIFSILILILSPMVVACLQIYFVDIEQAVLSLISLFIIIKTIFNDSLCLKTRIMFCLLSGEIIGIAIGIKYSIAPVGIAVLLSVCIFNRNIRNWIKISISYLFGMITGTLISGGWWAYLLYKKFHNPLFPFFNNIFASPMADKTPVLDFDYVYLRPHGIIDFLFKPLKSTFSQINGFEDLFYDIKMPIFAVSIFIICLLFFINKDIKNKINEIIDFNIFKFLIFFIIFDYYINLYIFGQYRYIIILYSLAPIIIVIACYLLSSGNKIYRNLFLVILASIIAYHFLYAYKHHSIFNDISSYHIACSIILICFIAFIILFIRNIKVFQKLFSVLLLCIFICNISTFIIEPTFIIKENMPPKSQIVSINDMNIPNDSVVLLATMLTAFIVPAQNKNVKYYGYVLPLNIAKSAFWSNTLYNNKYYQNKYLATKIREIFSKYEKIYMIFNLDELQDDLELYNQSIKYYSQNKVHGVNNCKDIDYQVFGIHNPFNKFIICEII